MRGSKLLTSDLSRGIDRHQVTPNPRCWSNQHKVLLPGHQVSPKVQVDLPLRIGHEGTHQASWWPYLMSSPLTSFSTKGGGLHIPHTQVSTTLHTKLEGWRIAREPLRPQGSGTPYMQLSSKPMLSLNNLQECAKPLDEHLITMLACMWSSMCLALL
jgi:hypothetical protein